MFTNSSKSTTLWKFGQEQMHVISAFFNDLPKTTYVPVKWKHYFSLICSTTYLLECSCIKTTADYSKLWLICLCGMWLTFFSGGVINDFIKLSLSKSRLFSYLQLLAKSERWVMHCLEVFYYKIRRIPNLLRKCKKVQTVSVINIGQLNVRCKSCKRVTLVRSSTLLIYFNLRNQEKYSDPSLFVTTDLKTFIIKRMVQKQWILEFTLCNVSQKVVLMTVICGFFISSGMISYMV